MPERGVAYSFGRGLYDATVGGHFRVNPTIVAGDFKISKDDGAFVNLATLPTVSPAGSPRVLFHLTAAEMTADRVTILGVDQAGGEWSEFMEHLEPGAGGLLTAVQVADAVLTRDWTALPGPPPAFSVWQALRALRNVWNLTPGPPPIWHIKAEDGVTEAWTRTVTTDAAAERITGTS